MLKVKTTRKVNESVDKATLEELQTYVMEGLEKSLYNIFRIDKFLENNNKNLNKSKLVLYKKDVDRIKNNIQSVEDDLLGLDWRELEDTDYMNESKQMNESDDTIIYTQIPDESIENFFPMYYSDADFANNGIVIAGNRDFKEYGDDTLIKVVKGDYEGDKNWNEEEQYYEDYDVLEMLQKVTGKHYNKGTMRGYSQSEWQNIYYPDEAKEEVDSIETLYMGKYKEFDSDEGSIIVPDEVVWDGKEAIRDYIAKEIGEKPENIKVRLFKGYKRTAEYDESLNKPLKESVNEEDRKEALANYLGIDVDTIKNTYDNYFETEDAEYLVVDEDEAREAAEEDIKNIFDELGIEAFTSQFQDWIIDNALEKEPFEDALRESTESYVEDIDYEEGRLEGELLDNDIITQDDIDNGYDEEDAKEKYVELLIEQAGDPVQYYIDNFGEKDATDFAIRFNAFDMDAIVDEAIDEDGIAHFISTYDGKEIELDNGLFAYRTN